MGLFRNGKEKHEKMIMTHYDGVPSFRANSPCTVILDEEQNCLKFDVFGSKNSPSVQLPLNKIIKAELVNVTEIEQQSKLGRAVVGGLLFGNTGAVIGALSAGEKKKIKLVYVINYNSNDTIKSISLKDNGNLNFFRFHKRLTELIPKQDISNITL